MAANERASNARRRLLGLMCCTCAIPLSPDRKGGERYCQACSPSLPREMRRVLMNFMHRDGWRVSFLEADCRTSLPCKLTFGDSAKIRTMVERYSCRLAEGRQALDRGIEIGRGSVWLSLTEQEYLVLKRQTGSRK